MDLDRFNKLLENQKDIEDNSPSFLEVIGRYYDENIISRYLLYILSLGTKLVSKRYMNIFKVFERVKIDSSYQVLSKDWKQDLFTKVEEGLEKLSIHQQEEVERYSRFKESINQD